MNDEQVLWEAEFNPRVTVYWLLSGAMVLTVTIVGIVLVPFWFLFGSFVTRPHLKSFRCTLTNRSLKFAKGWLVRIEKTVPLDRITDVGLVQGPMMRLLDIEALSVETAGQTSHGAVLQLAGIKDGRKFRDAILRQRDLVVGSAEDRPGQFAGAPTAVDAALTSEGNVELLRSIRDALLRIEEKINNAAR